MIVTTEQSFTKLKLLDKPIDDYSDDELMAVVESLRASRSRVTTKKPKTPGAAKPSKTKPSLDSLDDIG